MNQLNNEELILIHDEYSAIAEKLSSPDGSDLAKGNYCDPEHVFREASITSIFDIERFVLKIFNSTGVAFRKNKESSQIFDCIGFSYEFKIIDVLIEAYDDKFHYSPHVELFFTAVREVIPSGYRFTNFPNNIYLENGEAAAETFNRLIEKIRRKGKSKAFNQKIYSMRHLIKRGYENYAKYINSLFSLYPRLLVIRIDLNFHPPRSRNENYVTLKEAQEYLGKLLNNKRKNKIFNGLVGYIWKLEYGFKRGYHYHMLFFLDGHKARNDAYRAYAIGEYWKRITDERGWGHSCNAHREKYPQIGIGMIHRSDDAKRQVLLKIAKYFFKHDQRLRWKETTKVKSIGKAHHPSSTKRFVGRPRLSKNSV